MPGGELRGCCVCYGTPRMLRLCYVCATFVLRLCYVCATGLLGCCVCYGVFCLLRLYYGTPQVRNPRILLLLQLNKPEICRCYAAHRIFCVCDYGTPVFYVCAACVLRLLRESSGAAFVLCLLRGASRMLRLCCVCAVFAIGIL